MSTYTVHQAKTNLSKLIAEAEAGVEVVIARGATPVARLVPIKVASMRKFGAYKGLAATTDAFFEPLPNDELDAWEAGPIEPPKAAEVPARRSGSSRAAKRRKAGRSVHR